MCEWLCNRVVCNSGCARVVCVIFVVGDWMRKSGCVSVVCVSVVLRESGCDIVVCGRVAV